MRKLIFLAAAAVWAWTASAQPLKEVADERILSFEESAAPFEASRGSSLQISGDHYKHGSHSVRWHWSRPDAQLRIAAPVGYLAKNPNPRETCSARRAGRVRGSTTGWISLAGAGPGWPSTATCRERPRKEWTRWWSR